jgi:anti-sigma B factor antagonist
MTYQIDFEDDVPVVRVNGELDAVTVPELRNVLAGFEGDDQRGDGGLRLVLDLSGLRLIDSAGVGVLMAVHRRLQARGGGVIVRGLRNQPLLVFQLLRLDRVLTSEPTATV